MSPIESVLELRDKILTLVVRHPQPCSLHARKLAGSEPGLYRFAVLVELIGFEYAKTVFEGVPQSKWERIHQLFFSRLQELRVNPPSEILSELHAEFVGATLSWDPTRQSEGAFDFLKTLEPHLLQVLLRSEQAASVALLSLEWGEEDVASALNALPQPLRRDSVLAISRLRRMPEEILVAQARSFAEHLHRKLKLAQRAQKTQVSTQVAASASARISSAVHMSNPTPPPFRHRQQPSPWSRGAVSSPAQASAAPSPAVATVEVRTSRPAPSSEVRFEPTSVPMRVVSVDDPRVRRSIERITALSSFLCAEQDKAESAVKDLLSVKGAQSTSPAHEGSSVGDRRSGETSDARSGAGKNRRLPVQGA